MYHFQLVHNAQRVSLHPPNKMLLIHLSNHLSIYKTNHPSIKPSVHPSIHHVLSGHYLHPCRKGVQDEI